MKKNIIPILALVIASCGGGNNNQPQTQGSDTNTDAAASTAATTEDDTNSEDDLAGLPDMFIQFVNSLPKSPNQKVFSKAINNSDNYFENEGFMECEECIAYPKQGGGYMTIYAHTTSKYGSMKSMSFDTYTYKDGSLKRAQNILPVPPLQARQEADFNTFSSIYKKRPYDFIYYIFNDDEPIIRTVHFPPAGKDPEWNDKYYNYFPNQYDNAPTYRWDGEKFVQFDIFADFLNSLPKSPDKPVYHKSDGYGITEEFCSTEINYYAFPMKDGGYMAISSFNEQCEASMWWNDSTYIYKNGKIQSVDGILPEPEMITLLDPEKCKDKDNQVKNIIKQYNENPRGYLLYYIKDDGTMNVSAAGNGCDQWGECDLDLMVQAIYKWDGEKFVRTDIEEPSADNNNEDDNNVDQEKLNKFIAALPDHYTDSVYTFHSDGYANPDADFQSADIEYFFPYKSGGYLWFSRHCEGSAGAYFELYGTSVYKNGENKTIKDALPIPDIDDLLIDDQCEKNPELYEGLKKLYNANPADLLRYTYDEYKKVLEVYIYPEDEYDPSWNSDYFDLYNTEFMSFDPYTAKYTWNGERFIKKK